MLFDRVEDVDVVTGFRHRTFAEFLIAHHVVSRIIKNPASEVISDVLSPLFNYETTYFIKSLIATYGNNNNSIMAAFQEFIIKNIGQSENEIIIACHNSLHFFSACAEDSLSALSDIAKVLRRPGQVAPPLVLGTLLAALMTHGGDQDSEALIQELDSSSSLRTRNMNYHMLYYGDTDYTTVAGLQKFIKDGRLWGETRKVLLRRLRSSDSKRRAFRAYDLMTFRHFLEATRYSLTDSEIKEFDLISSNTLGGSSSGPLDQIARNEINKIKDLTYQHLVILIHGIRDHALWYDSLKRILEAENGVRVLDTKYGYFDLAFFLLPGKWRQRPGKKIWEKIKYAIEKAKIYHQKVTIIAHSNGTQVATTLLLKNPDFKIDYLILCGSVVDNDFDWNRLNLQIRGKIVNDYGIRDIWPIVAKSITWGYGNSGTVGFGSPVNDRVHIARHSHYLSEDFFKKYWIPLVKDGTLIQSSDFDIDKLRHPRWYSIFKFPWRWVILFVLIAAIATVVRRVIHLLGY